MNNKENIQRDGARTDNPNLIVEVLEKAHRENRTAYDLAAALNLSITWTKNLMSGKVTSVFSMHPGTLICLQQYLAKEDEVLGPLKGRRASVRRLCMMGSNNPRWNGGNSEYPDHATFKKNRIERLKKARGKCEICGDCAKIVHHKDENKADHRLENLIALCLHCHAALHTHDFADLEASS